MGEFNKGVDGCVEGASLPPEPVTVAFKGKSEVLAGARIRASEELPYPLAVDTDGTVRPATHGDTVACMAISSAEKGERVLVVLDLPWPG